MSRIRFEDTTPINKGNLDKLNNVVISSTTPTTGEEVWIDNTNKKIYIKNDNGVYEEFNIKPTKYTLTNTPSHSAGTNSYSLTKNGNIVVLNVATLWLNSITANTWVSLGNVPDELKPSISKGSMATITDGGNGSVVGFGKIDLTSDGLLQFKSSSASSSAGLCGITFEMTWILE